MSTTKTRYLIIASALLWPLLLFPAHAGDKTIAAPLTGKEYLHSKEQMGVVLLAVRWDRRWKCGGFDNAQLRLLGFDRLPSQQKGDDQRADIVLDDAPLLTTKPKFDDYAFLVEPGEYALSALNIKVARSSSDVGVFKIARSTLLKDGQPDGGSFAVKAGEVVYVGHFYIDCYREPTLWRFYLDGRGEFDGYLKSVTKQHPELDVSNVSYRLFKTKRFGEDYELK